MEEKDYPGIFDRVKASAIDSIVIVAFIGASSEILGTLDSAPNYYKMICVILIFLYEPIMVSLFGASIGHRMCKLKVQNAKNSKKISIIKAIIRFLMKMILGWISLFTISNNKERKTMHDMIVDSVVIFDEDYI